MIKVTQEFLNKGAAYKAVFMISELEKAHLAKTKDVVATADDREAANNLKQHVIDEISAFDHVDTGRLENSVGVRKMGDEYGVTIADYGKYVNGYDRESGGEGFLDVAVKQSLIDGDEVNLLV